MKMSILKTGTLLLALAALFVLPSCDKDDDTSAAELQEKIAGTWDFTSFKLGASEYMGTVVDSAYIEYETFTGAKGDFTQQVKYLDEDPAETTEGEYEVVDGNTVKMTSDGKTYQMEVTITGNNLQLEGTQDSKPLVIKAKKRS